MSGQDDKWREISFDAAKGYIQEALGRIINISEKNALFNLFSENIWKDGITPEQRGIS